MGAWALPNESLVLVFGIFRWSGIGLYWKYSTPTARRGFEKSCSIHQGSSASDSVSISLLKAVHSGSSTQYIDTFSRLGREDSLFEIPVPAMAIDNNLLQLGRHDSEERFLAVNAALAHGQPLQIGKIFNDMTHWWLVQAEIAWTTGDFKVEKFQMRQFPA